VNAVGRLGGEIEGRRGPRIDREEEGGYLGIPQNPSQPAHQPAIINPVPRNPRRYGGDTGPEFLGHRQGSGDDATTATERKT